MARISDRHFPLVQVDIENSLSPGTYSPMTGRVLGKIIDGFITPSGAWVKYPLSGVECKPAEFILFKRKGRRKISKIRTDFLKEIPEIKAAFKED